MTFDKEPVNVRIALARRALKLSQEKFAELIDSDQQSVSDWERGKHVPLKRSRPIIEQVLGVKIWED